jgi:hypothetical protein
VTSGDRGKAIADFHRGCFTAGISERQFLILAETGKISAIRTRLLLPYPKCDTRANIRGNLLQSLPTRNRYEMRASRSSFPSNQVLALPCIAWRSGEMERVMGIEPTLAAWEAAVLPLNYTRGAQDFIRTVGA